MATVAATAALVAVAVSVAAPITAAALTFAALAAAIDARTGRLPNHLVGLVGLVAAVGVVTAEAPGRAAPAAVAGALVLAGPLLASHLAVPATIGFGDVKLAAALGATIGPVDPRLGLVALCVASGSTAVVGGVARRRELPLGPGLVVGAVVAVALDGRVPW